MKIFNTLTRKKDEFVPIEQGKVKIYACGPTVYNYIHIGNARPLCVFDVLRRYLEWRGFDVTFVQNFTDIDDKMINRANKEGITVKELGERFIAEYFKDVIPENPYKEDPYNLKCISFSPNGDVLNGNVYRHGIMDIVENYKPMEAFESSI